MFFEKRQGVSLRRLRCISRVHPKICFASFGGMLGLLCGIVDILRACRKQTQALVSFWVVTVMVLEVVAVAAAMAVLVVAPSTGIRCHCCLFCFSCCCCCCAEHSEKIP